MEKQKEVSYGDWCQADAALAEAIQWNDMKDIVSATEKLNEARRKIDAEHQ